jgi:abortive infection bacteriophage resistance protein
LFLEGKNLKFTKPSTTFDEQIELLQSRGMRIPDQDRARHYLSHLNYYRISAYWLPFEADHDRHQFKQDANFEDVLNLYMFDRELRLLVMDATERFEVSLRTQWAYYLAHAYGPHAYLDINYFHNRNQYQTSIRKLQTEIEQSHETFIKHYKRTYTDPEYPPLWAAVEVMSLGQLSKFYSNLKHRRDRKQIASIYNLDEVVISSFLHHLTVVRNLCAHHSRLWNRAFTFTIKLPRRGNAHLLDSLDRSAGRKIYNTLVMLEYLMENISPGTRWKQKVVSLFEKYPVADPAAMGFPANWQALPVWKAS